VTSINDKKMERIYVSYKEENKNLMIGLLHLMVPCKDAT
jgi:hypothetical protein